jgi:hypothetical protein
MKRWVWIVVAAVALLVIGLASLAVYKAFAQGQDIPPGWCTHPFNVGEEVTLTATPKAGHIFVRWEGDFCNGSPTPTCTFVMPAKEVNIKAVFKPLPEKPRNVRIEDG